MPKPLQNWQTDNAVPLATPSFDLPYEEQMDGMVVRVGAKCLVHGAWSALAWDGVRLGPECCLVAEDG